MRSSKLQHTPKDKPENQGCKRRAYMPGAYMPGHPFSPEGVSYILYKRLFHQNRTAEKNAAYTSIEE
jgi:hypothetical protein